MYSAQWSRLDNAAKIFPPNTTRANPRVFRFSCELYETVDPAILQQALDAGLEEFPLYRSIIRRGLFWYYFEKSDLPSPVREEYRPPCAPLYNTDRKNLLFELTFFRRRINLEMYHALSDGVGAMQFFKNLIFQYLLEKHRGTLGKKIQPSSGDVSGGSFEGSSDEQKNQDAFDKYYSSKGKASKLPRLLRLPPAYRVRGEHFPDFRLSIIEGHISAAAILQKAHEYHATLGEMLAAQLICSIHEGMNIREEELPVSISIPVDLRKYFTTPSVRNFFIIINISYNFSTSGKTFEDVLAGVQESFKVQLTQEKIQERFNQLSALEHDLLIKMVPLAVKAPVLKRASEKSEMGITATLSNIGKILMPEEMVPHIRLFSVFSSTTHPYMCMCSFGDKLVISFSSPLVSSDVQRCFFRSLGDRGLDVEIISNTDGVAHAVLP